MQASNMTDRRARLLRTAVGFGSCRPTSPSYACFTAGSIAGAALATSCAAWRAGLGPAAYRIRRGALARATARREAAQDVLPKISWRTRYAFRMSSGRRRPETSAKIFSASSLGTADGLSARTAVSSRSGISSATDTRYRLSMEIDFSPRSTSPMNFPESRSGHPAAPG